MKDTPRESCEICSIDGLWTHQALNLESLIKGAYTVDGTQPNPLWNFDDLRTLVSKGHKLVEGEVATAEEGDIKGAEALIDHFSNPENVHTILDYYQLGNYTFQPQSINPVEGHRFTQVDEHPLPKAIADQYRGIINKVQTQTGRLLTLASGFRSPAYQLYLLCAGSYSRNREGLSPSLSREFQKIAPPYCSKHSDADNPAIDVADFIPGDKCVLDGAKNCADIRQNMVWKVFKSLAEQRGFKENYPEGSINNGEGEPWEFQRVLTEVD